MAQSKPDRADNPTRFYFQGERLVNPAGRRPTDERRAKYHCTPESTAFSSEVSRKVAGVT